MPKMVCVKCGTFFHVKKNGVTVEEGKPHGEPSPDSRTGWAAYKLWHADLWECLSCGTEVVAGFAVFPLSEHYMDNYKSTKEVFKPIVFVEDCL